MKALLIIAILTSTLPVAWRLEQRLQVHEMQSACELYAAMVERFAGLTQADRRGVVADWLARTKGDIEVQRIVMRAANYVETGGTVAAAWKLCEGESV